MQSLSRPARRFVDAFGQLGEAWGLPSSACRLHAYIFLSPSGVDRAHMAEALSLSEGELAQALSFLCDYKLVWCISDNVYKAHEDPWDALSVGLNQRRARDLPGMRAMFVSCRQDMAAAGECESSSASQIEKIIGLVDNLSAIHAGAFRLPPRVLRGMIGLSGRAARLLGNRAD
jgi:DNA-binding transcriptional regulator GbsR (MarR family)